MRKLWLVALLFMAVACGETPSTSSAQPESPAVVPASSQPPASAPASSKPPVSVPATSGPPVSAAPSPVTPVGNTMRTHKVPWISATPSAGGSKLDIVWWSGVEPCAVLDRVEVDEGGKDVTVTVYEGQDRRSPDAICIAIAIQKTTTVDLRAPLGDRKVVDGAK
ncbi:hypothetical protein [Microbispora sp. NPDC049125]|uniref:hypothetical protein n=1 Tax=Microbispora sp. NPDC049125 TaxID=3154929 RepID=UPI003466AC18